MIPRYWRKGTAPNYEGRERCRWVRWGARKPLALLAIPRRLGSSAAPSSWEANLSRESQRIAVRSQV